MLSMLELEVLESRMRSGLVATTMVEDTEMTVGMVEDMANLAMVVGLEAATSPDMMEDTSTKATVEAMDQDTVVVMVSLETVVVMVNLDMVVGKAAATAVARVEDMAVAVDMAEVGAMEEGMVVAATQGVEDTMVDGTKEQRSIYMSHSAK
jgi:C-terminal processing protease CtpA/Prc